MLCSSTPADALSTLLDVRGQIGEQAGHLDELFRNEGMYFVSAKRLRELIVYRITLIGYQGVPFNNSTHSYWEHNSSEDPVRHLLATTWQESFQAPLVSRSVGPPPELYNYAFEPLDQEAISRRVFLDTLVRREWEHAMYHG